MGDAVDSGGKDRAGEVGGGGGGGGGGGAVAGATSWDERIDVADSRFFVGFWKSDQEVKLVRKCTILVQKLLCKHTT